MTTEISQWKQAIKVSITEIRRLGLFGLTNGEMERYKSAILSEAEQFAAQSGQMSNEDVLQEVMEAESCGHILMDPIQRLEITRRLLKEINLDDIMSVAQSLCEHLSHIRVEDGVRPAAVIACCPKLDRNGEEFQVEEEEIKNVHIIFTSRVDWEENEIQSHFLSVTNLAKLCAKLLKYDIKGKKTSKYSDRNICETCHRLFTFDKKEALGPQLKKLKRDMVNGDWCRFKSQAYLEHVASCSSNSLATIRMPKEGASASFSKISALHDKPVITHFLPLSFFFFTSL